MKSHKYLGLGWGVIRQCHVPGLVSDTLFFLTVHLIPFIMFLLETLTMSSTWAHCACPTSDSQLLPLQSTAVPGSCLSFKICALVFCFSKSGATSRCIPCPGLTYSKFSEKTAPVPDVLEHKLCPPSFGSPCNQQWPSAHTIKMIACYHVLHVVAPFLPHKFFSCNNKMWRATGGSSREHR